MENNEEKIQQWFGSIIENSYDGIYITDDKANTIMINKAYETITGLTRAEVLGRNMNDLVKEGIISRSGSLHVLKTGTPVTLHQKFKTGRRALITSSPIYDDSGRIVLVVTNVRDMTEIYRLKEKPHESAEGKMSLFLQELDHMRSEFLNYDLVIEDPKTIKTLRIADRVKDLDTSVFLFGETGTGKEVFAKYIYQNSSRSQEPFIKINCGAIPENLMESELFGYEKGAFTGADAKGKAGLFEVADKGTIFMDEIGELPMTMQVKLLRVLQDQEITRVGGLRPIKVDVRLIAATNRNLEEMVNEGTFRKDLYYRLMVFPIEIPPLRERKGDIIPMIQIFTEQCNRKYGLNKHFEDITMELLKEYNWPGNIRELRNVVEQAVIVSNEDEILPDDLPILRDKDSLSMLFPSDNSMSLNDHLAHMEKLLVDRAYKRYGNVRDAAKSLGISPATFVRKRNRKDV